MSKLEQKKGSQAGFTLLELLVVLMVMGFLVAMVAPKLLGLFQDAEDTVCDTNIKDHKKYASAFEMQYNKLPDRMMVPGYNDTASVWYGPTEENITTAGREVFSTAILGRIRLMPHQLNAAEIREIIQELGIREVVVLNNPEDIQAAPGKNDIWGNALPVSGSTEDSKFKLITLDPAMAAPTWPMIGGGYDGAVWANHANWNAVGETIADPNWAYRLILGVGPDCELLHRILAAEGKCPSFERQAADDTMWGWYVMVLPRLQETVDRLAGSGLHREVTCWADSNAATSQRKTFDLSYVDSEYKRAAFDIFCPEGHRYPEEVEIWGIQSIDSTF
ncbi:MAG: prepilin-type N-terminal cleavage/methylation domain-containing protein [bacterium]